MTNRQEERSDPLQWAIEVEEHLTKLYERQTEHSKALADLYRASARRDYPVLALLLLVAVDIGIRLLG